MTENKTLPVDWTEWRKEWNAWYSAHASDLKQTAPWNVDKNFIADEVLGRWKVNGRDVELSEVTFPDLSGARRGEWCRYIGVTFKQDDGTYSGPLCESFAALEEALGL